MLINIHCAFFEGGGGHSNIHKKTIKKLQVCKSASAEPRIGGVQCDPVPKRMIVNLLVVFVKCVY